MTQGTYFTPTPSEEVQASLRKALKMRGHRRGQFTPLDSLMRASANACRPELTERWHETQAEDSESGQRRVHYLSMEFLMGRTLRNALDALNLSATFDEAAVKAGLEPADIFDRERDAALGNGGLGRLAACFLDSLATLGVPSFGYCLRYEYGMFAQRIQDGRQVEQPDDWLHYGTPWEFPRPELRYRVGFGGHVVAEGSHGQSVRRWEPAEIIEANAFDMIIPGHGTRRVSTLRQWKAGALTPLDFTAFSRGDYVAAAAQRLNAERLNWVLYPDDSTEAGRDLRLRQEFMLVSASLQDMMARHMAEYGSLQQFGEKVAVHLNDTHPALACIELLRLLIDVHGMSREEAYQQTLMATSYTNHTLMPEALETWPVRMIEALLPRHLELIYDLNAVFLREVAERFPGDSELISRVSLIDEHGERRVRMANVSIVLSHHINGVSKLHSDLMVETIFADFARIFPARFCNVTNGVTPRRWLAHCNRPLSNILDQTLGAKWRSNLDLLQKLAPGGQVDTALAQRISEAKRVNKVRLADVIRRKTGIMVSPDSLFDVQIKRVHEYKRQLLNLLHVVARYQAILANPEKKWTPRTVIFAGKAASAYVAAKSIIRLAHNIGRTINSDPRVGDKLKVVFLPNYCVSLAEYIFPAADLSEQISTAGTEASGTGNMKFALNGALTIGTWDGANIEMAERIGKENMFIFGLLTEEVLALKQHGYNPRQYYEENPVLRAAIDAIGNGDFSHGEQNRYRLLMDNLLNRDHYLLLADFAEYCKAQERVDEAFEDKAGWAQKVVRNISAMGFFSSDRTIADYAKHIWNAPLNLPES